MKAERFGGLVGSFSSAAGKNARRSVQFLSLATACAVTGLVSSSALGASGSWTGATDSTWADNNWSASPVPGTGDTATFNAAGNGNTVIDLGGGVTIKNILFDTSSAAAYTIGAGGVGNQTLTVNNGGSVTLTPLVANNELFNSNLILGTDQTAQTYTITNNSADILTLAGTITGGTGTGTAGIKTLNFNGTGNIVDTGILAFGSSAANFSPAKYGSGTFTLESSTASTYSGYTSVYAGTLTENFANFTSNNLISTASSLRMGGGAFQLIGNSTVASSQAFGAAVLGAGQATITVQAAGGGPNPVLALGTFAPSIGSAVMLTGPATATYSGGNSEAATSIPATATVTTTTLGPGTNGLILNVASGTAANLGAYATVGQYDWAATSGSSPYTIVGGSQVSGFYTATFGTNTDVPATGIVLGTGTQYGETLRFNTPSATAGTSTIVSNPSSDNVQVQGILVTPNMGAQNAGISGSTWSPYYGTTTGKANALQIWQNNTSGFFNFAAGFYNGRSGASTNSIVQNGPGTVVISGVNTQTGATYLNGGFSVVGADNAFGTPATAAAIDLNGGTVVGANLPSGIISTSGSYSVALDNAGANPRPITILTNGGGLAATAGTTLTIDGQIGSANTAGTLTIGIPASSSNGNTAGLLPGSGAGTANTTPVYGTGTVFLNFANGTAGNYQFSPTLITGGATLEINSQYDLGGGDAGSLTFNNGTLQYSATLATGTAGTATDISAQPVIFAGNATIDTNSHNINYANPIGYGGSGGLTVVDSTAGVKGSLTLNGSNSYKGATAINSGKLVLAPGASLATSGVTVNTGGTFQVSSTSAVTTGSVILAGGTVSLVDGVIGNFSTGSLNLTSGSVSLELNNSGTPQNDALNVTSPNGLTISAGTFNLYAAGGLAKFSSNAVGTYTLISYTGTDTIAGGPTALNTDLSIGNPVPGLTYMFTDTSSAIQLTIGGTPVTSGTWITDGGGSWASAANWSSSPAIPNSAGSTATFAGAPATDSNLNRAVTLDGTKTVGTLIFASPNGESYTINQGSGGNLIFDGANSEAAVTVSSGTHVINAPMLLNSGLDVTVATGGTISFNGNVSNGIATSTLIKDGTGTLILAGSNTYGTAAGIVGTTINGGTVQVANSYGFSTGDVAVTATATLQAGATGINVANNFNVTAGVMTVDTQANILTLSGAISGGGSLTVIGAGTLILSGAGTYLGTTTVNTGTVQLGAGGTNGYVSGNIIDNSALTLNRSDSYNLGNLISGTGTVTQTGSGNVTLTASNTYTGNTVVAAGTLTLGNTLAIQNSTLNYNGQGGTLSFGTLTAATISGLTGSQSLNLTNTTAGGVALTVQGAGTNTYTGTLGGLGSLIMNGTGTVTIGSGTAGGANYSGGTTVNNGTLVLGGVGNISAGTINITGSNGVSNLVVADSAQVTSAGTLSLDDSTTNGYPFTATLTVKNNSQLTLGGLSIGSNFALTGARLTNCTVTVQDNATLTVNGSFNLSETAGNTASNGTVNLNGGTLATQNVIFLGGGGAAGTTQIANVQFNGGVLEALANDPSGSTFFPSFPGVPLDVDAGGAIINTNSYSDTIAASLVHGSGTTDGGLTKIGAGTLTLAGNDTYKGVTNVSSGVLVLSQSASLPTGSNVSVSRGAALVDAQNAVVGRAGSLNINGSLIIQNSQSLQSVTQAVTSGFNGGTWTGTGTGVISSSAAAGDTTHLTALGLIQNDSNGGAGGGAQLYSSFEGYTSLNDSDVLVKRTYYGDTDLNGEVDGSDYSRIDNAYLYNRTASSPLTGWFNGDFNYDGVIDGSDYTLIDNAYNSQGTQIASQIATATDLIAGGSTGSSVPEPTALGLVAMGATGLLGRRRRHVR